MGVLGRKATNSDWLSRSVSTDRGLLREEVDCLIVGHLCLDEKAEGFRLGGTVTYAGIAASSLGYRVGIVTSARPDVDLSLLRDRSIQVECRHSRKTTQFRNTYTAEGHRRQQLLARADDLGIADVPQIWQGAPLVLLSPVVQEIEGSLIDAFSASSLLGLTLQGWLRTWDVNGAVTPTQWREAAEHLRRVNVVVLSLEDVGGDWDEAMRYARMAHLGIITLAGEGAAVVRGGETRRFPARPARVVDPTGAGDVFAAAFLIRYYETADAVAACQFANVMASLSTEEKGWKSIPSRSDVEALLEAETNGDR
jgi:sugar/nucleoside kinase (ribokinase family)